MALNLLRKRFAKGVRKSSIDENQPGPATPSLFSQPIENEDSLSNAFGQLPSRPRGVSARVLHALRKMRDKPESLLKDREKAYSLLIHAAREADAYSHELVDISENQQQSLSSSNSTFINTSEVLPTSDDIEADDVTDEDSDSNDEQAQQLPTQSTPVYPSASSRSASFSSAASPQRDQLREVKKQLRADCSIPIRRVNWVRFVPRYMPLLCDAYCAEKVFDVLTQSAPLRLVNSALIKSDTISSDKISSDKTSTTTSCYEKLLTFDLFERYVKALCKTLLGTHTAWDGLREALELEPTELCVKVEKYVECFIEFSVHSRVEVRKGNTSRIFEVPVASVSELPIQLPSIFQDNKRLVQPLSTSSSDVLNPNTVLSSSAVGRELTLRQFIKEREVAEAKAKRAALYASDSAQESSSDESEEEKSGSIISEDSIRNVARNKVKSKRSASHRILSSSSSLPDLSASGLSLKSEVVQNPQEDDDSVLDDSASLIFDGEGDATLAVDEALDGDQALATWELEALVQDDIEGEDDEGNDDEVIDTGDGDDSSFMGNQGLSSADLDIGSIDATNGIVDDDTFGTETEEASDIQGVEHFAVGENSPLNPAIEKKKGSLRGALGWLSQTSSKLRTSVAVVAAAQKEKTKKLLQRVGERAKAVIKGSPLKANAGSLGAAAESLRLTSISKAYAALGLHPAAAASLLSRGTATLRLRGTFILTNKSIYFIANRNEAIIIPLHSVPGLEDCMTTAKTLGFTRKVDNGLRLNGCDIRRAAFDPDKDLDALSKSALKTLFVLSDALEGQSLPINKSDLSNRHTTASTVKSSGLTAAAAIPSSVTDFSSLNEIRSSSGSLFEFAIDEIAKAASSTGASVPGGDTFILSSRARVRPQISFTFSRLKDLLVSRGNERKEGGRRKVIKDAITELLAAHRLTALYEAMLTHHLEGRRDKTRLRVQDSLLVSTHNSSSSIPTLAPLPSAVLSSRTNNSSAQSINSLGFTSVSSGFSLKSVKPKIELFHQEDLKLISQMQPSQIDIALGRLTLSSLATLPWSSDAWKQHLDSKNRPPISASFSRRLSLYASLLVIRERSLLKATRKTTSVLQVCSHACPPIPRLPSGEGEGGPALIPDPSTTLVLANSGESILCVRRIMLIDDPLWLARLTSRMSKEKIITIRRAEKISLFEMRRLKSELDTFLDAVVFPLNVIFRRGPQYVMSFQNPVLSLSVMTVVAAWLLVEDLHKNTFSLLFLLPACGLLAYGSLSDSHRAFFLDLCTRERKPRAKNLIERLTRFRTTLGENQARLRRVNTIMLKLKSLVTWRDEARTSIFVAVLFAIGFLVNILPVRLLVGIFFINLVRKKLFQPQTLGPGVTTLAFDRWYEGLIDDRGQAANE
jgi:hypothetical protein